MAGGAPSGCCKYTLSGHSRPVLNIGTMAWMAAVGRPPRLAAVIGMHHCSPNTLSSTEQAAEDRVGSPLPNHAAHTSKGWMGTAGGASLGVATRSATPHAQASSGSRKRRGTGAMFGTQPGAPQCGSRPCACKGKGGQRRAKAQGGRKKTGGGAWVQNRRHVC